MRDTPFTRYVSKLPFPWEPRWNDLRRIGNSSIARASIAVPVLGYVILFHSDLIEYLRIHSSFCKDCTVSWRMHFLYFACCCFASGSIIYTLRCPRVIKEYGVTRDFYQGERNYYCNQENLRYFFGLFDREREAPDDPHHLRDKMGSGIPLPADELPQLAGLMGQFFFIQNRKHPYSRAAVFVFYSMGFVLLAVPTVITFFQVLLRVLNT
jgi:hypothetical protein